MKYKLLVTEPVILKESVTHFERNENAPDSLVRTGT